MDKTISQQTDELIKAARIAGAYDLVKAVGKEFKTGMYYTKLNILRTLDMELKDLEERIKGGNDGKQTKK